MTAQMLAATSDAIEQAAELLRDGEVVGAPTETVYGLAALARDERALAKVFAAKERPTFDPLIVHVVGPKGETQEAASFDWLAYLGDEEIIDVGQLTPDQRRTMQTLSRAFWPGPLTLVLPKHDSIPDLATSGLPTVAVRVPARPAMQRLIHAAGGPLAAPSANRFGGISPTEARAVFEELGQRIPLILDDGPCEIGLESTVVAIADTGKAVLLRPGGVSVERLERALDAKVIGATEANVTDANAPLAPGRLPSHYAPRKPLSLLPAPIDVLTAADLAQSAAFEKGGVGVLAITGDPDRHFQRLAVLLKSLGLPHAVVVQSLSISGNETEAAQNLFRTLRALDAHPSTTSLLAEPVTSLQGLGFAIADRLTRASAKISSSGLENPSTFG